MYEKRSPALARATIKSTCITVLAKSHCLQPRQVNTACVSTGQNRRPVEIDPPEAHASAGFVASACLRCFVAALCKPR